eukprot:CAMPEP_0182470880 /NCGR_PEP_ID=MMETSP1319-20130603/19407_1 /TAXON_ID=172717 /ORGANISM="Bolidomonas pacifica, Strain RCC208" /LENGTH=456 /DNA_ID=CAMNT_0024671381 /DNA_START=309 /DNA_END=1679 /DNA_ORIENTATION=-
MGLSLFAVLVFTFAVFVFETALDVRQRAVLRSPEEPKKLYDVVGQIDKHNAVVAKKEEGEKKEEPLAAQIKSKFSSSTSYALDKINLSLFSQLFELSTGAAFMLAGAYPFMWRAAAEAGGRAFGWNEREDELKVSVLFFVLTTLVGEVLNLPISVYSTFHVEKKHGFNKTTPSLYITDKLKSLLLSFLIGSPVITLLLYIVKSTGPRFYLYAWALMFCFSVAMMTIYPAFIMPMFNKFDPLPDGPLKESIEALAKKVSYPLTKLFVIDGSKRSSHSNAFMFGFGKNKRIVLFDTLMTQVTQHELLSILGHELGHWALSHTLVNFFVTQLYFGAAFFGFGTVVNSSHLYAAFGFDRDFVPTFVSLMIFMFYFWAPADKVISFLLTVNTRAAEFAADRYSINLGMKGLQSGLTKIHIENLGAMKCDWAYSAYHYSHPPLVERLVAMAEEEEKFEAKQK